MKTKIGREVSQAFEKILTDGYKPKHGTERQRHGVFKFHVPVDGKNGTILNFTPVKTKTLKRQS